MLHTIHLPLCVGAMLGFQTAVALAVLLCCHAATAAPPHTVIVMLHDDLGSYDTQVG